MEKINIAELLRDCPTDMELDCVMYEDVYFDHVDELNIIHCYIQRECNRTSITFNQHGTIGSDIKTKCVIFPKGKTTWEGFHRPFNDGDILVSHGFPFIYKGCDKTEIIKSYCGIDTKGNFWKASNRWTISDNVKFATEEQKEKLLKVIKYNGYRWNPETKKLEKLIKPIFKKGDKVRVKKGFPEPRIARIIEDVGDTFYTLVSVGKINFTDQNNWELVPNKFDISKLKPFDQVLVRDFDSEVWEIDFFSKLLDGKHFKCHGASYVQCIPYKGNEHLHNSTDACNDYFKTWEK